MSDGFSNDVDPTQCHTRFGILIVLSNMRQRPTAMFLDILICHPMRAASYPQDTCCYELVAEVSDDPIRFVLVDGIV